MTLSEFVISSAQTWFRAGEPVAIATIASVRGSSSQPLGSRLAATTGGTFVGFVSGGCVENDVYERAKQVLADGIPRRLHYKQVRDSLFEIGLNCDGQIDVVLERLDDRALAALRPASGTVELMRYRDTTGGELEVEHLTVRTHPGSTAGELAPDVQAGVNKSIDDWLAVSLRAEDGWNYLIEPERMPATLLIVSASSAAFPLSKIGKALGYRVVVSDPRSDYLSDDMFPDADLLLPVWPRELPDHITFGPNVFVVSLNHEPRFEDDLFRTLQSQPAVGYIGAIGKRKRHTERIARQEESGFDLGRLPTVHTPVGLDLGGKSAEEVALSVLAQIQAIRNGRPGGGLSDQKPSRKTTSRVSK